MSAAEFAASVTAIKELISQGEAYQVVLSLRLGIPFAGDPFAIYRALRLINPSPFLYFYRMDGLAIAGSSPELMTRVRDGIVYSRPIAGTRPRESRPRRMPSSKTSSVTIPRNGRSM